MAQTIIDSDQLFTNAIRFYITYIDGLTADQKEVDMITGGTLQESLAAIARKRYRVLRVYKSGRRQIDNVEFEVPGYKLSPLFFDFIFNYDRVTRYTDVIRPIVEAHYNGTPFTGTYKDIGAMIEIFMPEPGPSRKMLADLEASRNFKI